MTALYHSRVPFVQEDERAQIMHMVRAVRNCCKQSVLLLQDINSCSLGLIPNPDTSVHSQSLQIAQNN